MTNKNDTCLQQVPCIPKHSQMLLVIGLIIIIIIVTYLNATIRYHQWPVLRGLKSYSFCGCWAKIGNEKSVCVFCSKYRDNIKVKFKIR